MDTLLLDLFELMSQRAQPTSEQWECLTLRERHLERVQERMGSEFCDKLRDAVDECAQLDAEEAFHWGLRLGLALNRL